MKVSTALLLTLGHNSSAIYYDGSSALGYEEERLNRVKSSSAYPRLSIEEIEKNVLIAPGSYVFVSHWFDDLNFFCAANKYFDKEHFDSLVLKYDLKPVFLSETFTHHDAHAWSVVSFMRNKWNSRHDSFVSEGDKCHVIVADGYGTHQEVISVYELSLSSKVERPTLVKKYMGYNYSMGLMYQYATSYCDMKENQDEYKFLGYETHISRVLSQDLIAKLRGIALGRANHIFESLIRCPDSRSNSWRSPDTLVNFNALAQTKSTWYSHFSDVINAVAPDAKDRDVRMIIGHYIQELIENVIVSLVKFHDMKHVSLAGGIFYNVKLNNKILNSIPGLFCVVPLAGDQGCGVGMYEAHVGNFNWGDLKWGKRPSFKNWAAGQAPEELARYGDRIRYYGSEQRSVAVYDTMNLVANNKLVNVVKSNMEFGPRALCSTTTLSMPTKENVMIINELNDRDTVMPMAPVILDENIDEFFDGDLAARVIGSDEYMILTYDYKDPNLESYGGVAHKYPDRNVWSGRPQRVCKNDTFMHGVLSSISSRSKALINTSFNAHGRPIVYDISSVLDSFKFEFDRALQLNFDLPYLFLCDFDG